MTTITVPAVAAALLTVPRDCETCGNESQLCCEGASPICPPCQAEPCPDCRMACEWVAVDDPLEVGSTVHIVAGPLPDHQTIVGNWKVLNKPWRNGYGAPTICFDDELGDVLEVGGVCVAPLRPGVVVATGVVTECQRLVDGWTWQAEDMDTQSILVFDPPHEDDTLSFRTSWGEYTDISDQRLDQDWSPTRPCPACDGHGAIGGMITTKAHHPIYPRPCAHCDGARTLPRYAIRLTNVETKKDS